MHRFWIIAVALFVWSIMGDAAYIMQVTASPDSLGDPITAQAFETMPPWAWGAYAIAVWTGTVGAVALLMRRKAAWVLFAVSLAGIIVQFGWSIFGFGIVEYKGPSSLIFPGIVAAIATFAMFYAYHKKMDRTLR